MKARRLFLRIVLILTVLLVVVGYPIVAYLGYNFLSLAPTKAAPATPTGSFEDVSFSSRGQNYNVNGFYLPGKPDRPALINIHGWRGSRFQASTLARAEQMRDELGYSVLSIDLSDSTGSTVGNGRISMGYEERYDVLGAYDYLLTRGFAPGRIGLVGESMGATTSLLAAALEPRIRAVWADSPFARPDVVASEQAESFGFPRIVVPGGMVWGLLITGHAMWDANAVDQGPTLAANKTNVQLVHCDKDDFVYYHHSQDLLAAYQAANAEVQLWTVTCTKHATARIAADKDYTAQLDQFFTARLSGS